MDSRNCFSPRPDELLGEEDCISILEELETVAHRWYDIGLSLGFKSSTLDSIKSKGQDVHELLRNMIIEWLKMSYNVERFGPPTWRRIVEAVRANSGGKNPALADILARKHSVVVQDTQPVTISTSITIPRTDETPSTCSCCCFTLRVSENQATSAPNKGLNEIPLHPIPNGTTGGSKKSTGPSTNLSHTPSRSNSAVFFQKVELIRTNSATSRKPVLVHTRSHTYTSPDCCPYSIKEESNLIESSYKSRDIDEAHPSWQIEEIVQQEGYWGAMTGVMAEQKLRRHGRGNCYLIRYSEKKNHFVVSVMRRNIQNMSQPTYHHFKLNVIKEDGYEIEGSEKKFKDISSLFEFYKTNPLTCTNCIIGKACSPPLPLQYIN